MNSIEGNLPFKVLLPAEKNATDGVFVLVVACNLDPAHNSWIEECAVRQRLRIVTKREHLSAATNRTHVTKCDWSAGRKPQSTGKKPITPTHAPYWQQMACRRLSRVGCHAFSRLPGTKELQLDSWTTEYYIFLVRTRRQTSGYWCCGAQDAPGRIPTWLHR